jgi:hypothetical protein
MEERNRKAKEGNKHSHMEPQRHRTHLHGPEKHHSHSEILGIDRDRQQDIRERMAENEESRDEVWGWQEENENEEGEESRTEYEDREEGLEVNDGENVEEDKMEGEMVEDEEARRKKLVEERCNKGGREDHG